MKSITLLFLICIIGMKGQSDNGTPKALRVSRIPVTSSHGLEEVSRLLEKDTERQSVDLINWERFPYRPEVHFRIAHSEDWLWIKFYVDEEFVLAERTETNSATHRDSCVEFFLDPMGDGNYYNFEFNCIGTVHLAYGPARQQRTFIDPDLIEERIRISSTLGTEPFDERGGGHHWEMTVGIPVSILTHDEVSTFGGLAARANFYKCADDTTKPHYLSWNPVGTDRPDFHRPEYFGSLIFE